MQLKSLTPNLLIGIVLSFGVIVAATFGYIFISITEAEIEAFIAQLLPKGLLGIGYLIFLIGASTSIGLPRQVTAFASGFMIGPFWGTLTSLIGVTIGCFITYSLSHRLSHLSKVSQHNALFTLSHQFFAQDTFYKALMIRILPVGSNFITNIIAGLSHAPKLPYITGSALGFIPQLYIFALAGSGVRLKDTDSLYVSLALLGCASALGAWLYQRANIKEVKKTK